MKNNITKIIIFIIIIVLVVAGIRFFYKKQEIYQADESLVINTTVKEQNIIVPANEVINEISVDQNLEIDEVPVNMEEHYISIGKWKKFEFNTPVGQDGKFIVYAENAVQARGFTGASSHIYYLREGELYYHNQNKSDVKLATDITDLKIQGEDIIAVKGKATIIHVENKYIQYK